jgi:hypothetical protein
LRDGHEKKKRAYIVVATKLPGEKGNYNNKAYRHIERSSEST